MPETELDYLYYCTLCKKSIFDKKKHYFTNSHKDTLHAYLDKKLQEYNKYRIFLNDIALLKDLTEQPNFWCSFCEKEIDAEVMAKRQKINNQHNLFACHQIFKHLASNSHRSNVESFWNLHRPFTIKSKVQNKKVGDPVKGCSFLKDQFILTKQALEEFHSKCKTRILSMNSASAKTLENEVKSKEPIVSMPLSTLRIFKKQPHPLNSNLNKNNLLSGFDNETRFTVPENDEDQSSIFEEHKAERSQTLSCYFHKTLLICLLRSF
ncbi:Coiled-coil domain-containing protein 84, variant 2 [Entomophthora muscae]|uniref:Coiled-coil domain-containing protein 84, variant 2 n=1 Tax=Entomophthora muscae TaxID=34485 RepID=A0ACC2T9D3_9FUNG|nr:Coiled-coil domain-containing protein 84, variant 2 [Entomophthora muscae]